MSGLNKITIERNQKTLLELVVKPGNGKLFYICADCKARNPRWASHNLGIFICVNCASIHRKIGTHITKVKSLTMDSWTKEQVETMKSMGNIKSNAIFNPNELRYPPPPNLMDAERDSELEQYIRSKYEYRRFFDRSALVASKLGPSRSATSIASSTNTRSVSTPHINATPQIHNLNSATPTNIQPQLRPSAISRIATTQSRSVSQPSLMQSQPQSQQPQQPSTPQSNGAAGSVWEDLVSLQTPGSSSSLPLQFQTTQPVYEQNTFSGNVGSYQGSVGMATNPFQQQPLASNPYSGQQQQYASSSPTPSFPFSAGASSFSPIGQQHQQIQNQFFQPQPQQGHLQQLQISTHNQTSFASPVGQTAFMSAPAGQSQFMSPNPVQQFPSHSPQPQLQMMSSTPQPQMQMQMPMQQGQYMTHSPGMGMGMMTNTPQHGQFLSTTPQPQTQMQMQMQAGQYISGTPQSHMQQMMSQPQGQYEGYQIQGQPQTHMFSAGSYTGQQWGAM